MEASSPDCGLATVGMLRLSWAKPAKVYAVTIENKTHIAVKKCRVSMIIEYRSELDCPCHYFYNREATRKPAHNLRHTQPTPVTTNNYTILRHQSNNGLVDPENTHNMRSMCLETKTSLPNRNAWPEPYAKHFLQYNSNSSLLFRRPGGHPTSRAGTKA